MTAHAQRSNAPAPAPPAATLAGDMATLTALAPIVAAHPDLPELLSRRFDADGMHAQPYLHTRPLTGLLAWLDALPCRMAVKVRQAPEWSGTEVYATGRLHKRTITLNVITFRPVEASGDGLVSMVRLRRAAALETRNDGQPDDPATADGTAVAIEDDPDLTIPPPADVRAGTAPEPPPEDIMTSPNGTPPASFPDFLAGLDGILCKAGTTLSEKLDAVLADAERKVDEIVAEAEAKRDAQAAARAAAAPEGYIPLDLVADAVGDALDELAPYLARPTRSAIAVEAQDRARLLAARRATEPTG